MRGVNKVIVVGNLGNDPEMRTMPSGAQVANISVATTESWKDKQTGEKQERTEWHRIAMFGRLAEIAGEYLKKGGQVYIEGSLRTRKWQDKQGNDRYSTEIVAQEMQMLGSPRGGGGGGGQGHQQERERQEGRDYEPVGKKQGGGSAPKDEDFDDDIPFSWLFAVPLLPALMWGAHAAQALY